MGDKSYGSAKKNYYKAAKTRQDSHRQRRLKRVLQDREKKLARAETAGRDTRGLQREIEQLRYALSYQRPQGKKGGATHEDQPFTPEPPHHRPPGFWNRHKRVWGQLAHKMRVKNGEIIPSSKVDQFLQSEAAKTVEESFWQAVSTGHTTEVT